jgi:TatD DNase family protein
VDCGCNPRSCESALALAARYAWIYAACGVHPEDCEAFGDPGGLTAQMLPFWREKKCVAVGEIGLDYHYDIDKPTQRAFFEAQLRAAAELDLPVIVHDREAHGDTMELLRKYRPKGVLHCFSGSVEMAKEAVQLGLYIGFGGAVTFKNARKPLEAAAAVPPERLLLETDCPYMAPVPYRGKRCDSSMIPLAAEKIAALHEMSAQALLDITCRNAKTLFAIPDAE